MTVSKAIDLFDRLLGTSSPSMSIQSGWNLQLHAKHPPKNIFRWYCLRVDQTLFGEWCLSISYGRIGHRGHTKHYYESNITALTSKIKPILRRRLNATNRIGCNYEIMAFSR